MTKPTPIQIAARLAELLVKYGGSYDVKTDMMTFPSKKKQNEFMKEWMGA